MPGGLPPRGGGRCGGLWGKLGDLCFKGLPQQGAVYSKHGQQKATQLKTFHEREVVMFKTGYQAPCPHGNPLAEDLTESWMTLGGELSPQTATEANRLWNEWANGSSCPGANPWTPIPGQWHRALGDFGTFYGGLLGANMYDPSGRQYGANELRESPHCYTLLETYLRFCTQPPRLLQLREHSRTLSLIHI